MLRLSKYQPGNQNEHFTISIHSPWSENHTCKFMFPEWASIAMSEFILLGYIGKEATHLLPVKFPELQFAKDGLSAWYSFTYQTGVVFEASVSVVNTDMVQMKLKVTNHARRFFPGIDFAACLNLTDMGEEFSGIDPKLKIFASNGVITSFKSLHHLNGNELNIDEKMYVQIPVEGTPGCYEKFWSNGVWTKNQKPVIEKACLPFIARKSERDNRFIAIFWPRARYIMSNAGLACIHADPTIPNCPSGEQVLINGGIIFHHGNEESLFKRIKNNLASLSEEEITWRVWHI